MILTAHGRPVPQGTIRSLGKGRPSIHGNANSLLPWRQTIAAAASAAARGSGWERSKGPLIVRARFYFDRPMGHYGRKGLRPSAPAVPFGRGVGDIDKLARGLLDAISDSGAVWFDDAQVVQLLASKVYVPDESTTADLDRPGVLVWVEPSWIEVAA